MLKEYFQIILDNYEKVRKEKLFGHDVAEIIREKIPKILRDKTDDRQYLVVGSIGKGNIAEVPWIAILDNEITKTVQEGYDVVYLFDSMMRGFYLSLNQGVEQYGKGNTDTEIIQNTKILRSNLSDIPEDLSLKDISLAADQELGQKYEIAHICGKFYSKDKIPSDEELFNDLERMLGIYKKLKEEVGTDIRKLQKEEEKEKMDRITGLFKK